VTNPNVLSSTNAFQTFNFPDTSFPIGTIIYAGVIIDNYAQGKEPARIDKDGNDSIPNYPPNNQSFIASQTSAGFATVDPHNMPLAQLPLVPVTTALGSDGTWLIRLNAYPEPSSLALLGLAGLALSQRRSGLCKRQL